MSRQILSLMMLLMICPILGYSKVRELTRNAQDLVDPVKEKVLRVKTARVVLADYDLIREDFPVTKAMTNAQIDEWLLDRTAFVSVAQAQQKRVNTPIPVLYEKPDSPVTREAHRPQLYGRALVFDVEGGLIDVKGVGKADRPTHESHSSGLATLGEAIREYNFQKMVQRVFEHSGSGLQTVESYAVIDWGFDAIEADWSLGEYVRSRAGAILRQAHVRPRIELSGNHFASYLNSKIIEELLRRYGITSAGDSATPKLELTNIQSAKTGEIVDFGGYLVKERFQADTAYYTNNQAILLSLKEPGFVQPDARIRLPVSHWGSTETGKEQPRYDNPWIWAHRLAEDIRIGSAQPANVLQHHREMIKSAALPAELKGQFKNALSYENRIRVLKDLIQLSINTREIVHYGLIKDYFDLARSPFDRKMLDLFVSACKEPYQFKNLWDFFKANKVFDLYPDMLEAMIFKSKYDQRDPLDEALARGKVDLILEMLRQQRISWRPARVFLLSPQAQTYPQWKDWVMALGQTDSPSLAIILRDVPKAEKYPELFLAFLESSPRPDEISAVLSKDHWKMHPELVDKAILSILSIDRGYFGESDVKKSMIQELLKGKNWFDHPRMSIWKNWEANKDHFEEYLRTSESGMSCRDQFK